MAELLWLRVQSPELKYSSTITNCVITGRPLNLVKPQLLYLETGYEQFPFIEITV